jgi:ribosomal protein S27AE
VSVHRAVARARQAGDLVPEPCESCAEPRALAHHDDYARPLDVRWLCRKCHARWHTQNGSGANREVSGIPSYPLATDLTIRLRPQDVQRIETIRKSLGIQSHTEVVRFALTLAAREHAATVVHGAPTPQEPPQADGGASGEVAP